MLCGSPPLEENILSARNEEGSVGTPFGTVSSIQFFCCTVIEITRRRTYSYLWSTYVQAGTELFYAYLKISIIEATYTHTHIPHTHTHTHPHAHPHTHTHTRVFPEYVSFRRKKFKRKLTIEATWQMQLPIVQYAKKANLCDKKQSWGKTVMHRKRKFSFKRKLLYCSTIIHDILRFSLFSPIGSNPLHTVSCSNSVADPDPVRARINTPGPGPNF